MRKIIILLLIFSSANLCLSQDRFGISYSPLDINYHSASFYGLPGIPSCCQFFESSIGTGFKLGILYERDWDGWPNLFKANYATSSVLFEKNEDQVFAIIDENGVSRYENGTILHELDVDYKYLNIDFLWHKEFPDMRSVYWDLGISLGIYPDIGDFLDHRFKQTERIINPKVGTFENNQSSRLNYSGNIPDFSHVRFNFYTGFSWEFWKIGKTTSLDFYSGIHIPVFSSVIGNPTDAFPFANDFAWVESTLEFGISIKFGNPCRADCDDYNEKVAEYNKIIIQINEIRKSIKNNNKLIKECKYLNAESIRYADIINEMIRNKKECLKYQIKEDGKSESVAKINLIPGYDSIPPENCNDNRSDKKNYSEKIDSLEIQTSKKMKALIKYQKGFDTSMRSSLISLKDHLISDTTRLGRRIDTLKKIVGNCQFMETLLASESITIEKPGTKINVIEGKIIPERYSKRL